MITQDSIISEIIKGNPERALVLDRYGIEFYRKPDFSLSEACRKKNVDFNKLLEELEILGDGNSILNDWNKWSLDFLITYIENNHHSNMSSTIAKYSPLVFSKYFNDSENPDKEITELFDLISIHLRKEEKMLFPYIKQLEIIYNHGLKFEYANFGTLDNPIAVIKKEHSEICNKIENLISMTNNFDDILIKERIQSIFENLKKDIHMHIYLLEVEVFPRAAEIEKRLINRNSNLLQN